MAPVLFIFGPSCGGKSTLSKALAVQLGPSWTYIDRDQLIDDGLCCEEEADLKLEEKIACFQSNDQDLLVDTSPLETSSQRIGKVCVGLCAYFRASCKECPKDSPSGAFFKKGLLCASLC